jgi:hypothetical protein
LSSLSKAVFQKWKSSSKQDQSLYPWAMYSKIVSYNELNNTAFNMKKGINMPPDNAMGLYENTPVIRMTKVGTDVMRVLGPLGGFIAGGFAAWALDDDEYPVEPTDIDVYCTDSSNFDRMKARMTLFGNVYVNSNPKKETIVALSYDVPSIGKKCIRVQLIKPDAPLNNGAVTSGSPEVVINSFDFVVCKAALYWEEDKIKGLVHPSFQSFTNKKQMGMVKCLNPIAGIIRLLKYARKGYKCGIHDLLLLIAQCKKMKTEDWERIEKLAQKGMEENGTAFGADALTEESYSLAGLLRDPRTYNKEEVNGEPESPVV